METTAKYLSRDSRGMPWRWPQNTVCRDLGGGEYLDDGGQDIRRGGVTELVDLLGKPLTRTNNTWPHHYLKLK
jgi:hypothetical protein